MVLLSRSSSELPFLKFNVSAPALAFAHNIDLHISTSPPQSLDGTRVASYSYIYIILKDVIKIKLV